MGYTTDFEGEVVITPALNEAEISYLQDFSNSRRMDREEGPYFVRPGNNHGQEFDSSTVRNPNGPPAGQPGLWCQWEPSEDGLAIGWDGGEKFYYSSEWMDYLIHHFLAPGAVASLDLQGSIAQDSRFADFTFDHSVSGIITAQGEEASDMWRLVVTENHVETQAAQVVWPD